MRLQDQPLGQLARRIPGATGIFHDYDLDFCCGGKQTLRDAAAAKGLDAEAIETACRPCSATANRCRPTGAPCRRPR